MGQAPQSLAKAASEWMRELVSACGQEQLGRDVGPDPEGLDKVGRCRPGELLQHLGMLLDLVVQLQPTPGEGAQHVAHRGGDIRLAATVEGRRCAHQLAIMQPLELASEFVRSRHQDRLESDHGLALNSYGAVTGRVPAGDARAPRIAPL